MTEVEYVFTEPESEVKKPEDGKRYFKTDIVWFNVIGFLILHLAALYGVYLSLTLQVKALTILWAFSLMTFTGFSVTAGAHRLWSHRSYKAVPALKMILLLGQTMAGQNCLWVWVRDHRQHHKYSDKDPDPHNASRGFFFAHMGWLMMRKHPEVLAKGKGIDMSDLNADPWIMFQKNHYKKLYTLFAFFLPVAIPCILWGETLKNSIFISYFARFIISVNLTWLVNSYAHFFGTKPYNKDIRPVDSLLVSTVGLGEGWHNYHHTFPWDYRAGELSSGPNLTTAALDLLALLGLVFARRSPAPTSVRLRAARTEVH